MSVSESTMNDVNPRFVDDDTDDDDDDVILSDDDDAGAAAGYVTYYVSKLQRLFWVDPTLSSRNKRKMLGPTGGSSNT